MPRARKEKRNSTSRGLSILVTGGLGAVGRFLVAELEAAGHAVTVADRQPNHERANYARCDVGEFRQVEQLFSGRGWKRGSVAKKRRFDLVYHIAAEFGRWNGEDFYENLWRTNAVGTKNVLRMQEREGFRAVYFSSSEVYGDYAGRMREDVMDRVEIKQLNDYALTKWVNEQQVLNSARQFGTQSVRVRLFNAYGPGEYYGPYRSVICLFCYRLLHGLPIEVNRGHRRTATYVGDMARTLAVLAQPKKFRAGQAYNIGGSDYHRVEEYARIVLEILGRTPGKLVKYRPAEEMTTRVKRIDGRKAARELGHRTTVTLEDGIARTIEWMRGVYGK